jgi:aspartate-semialdehyde dehydrogenase
MNQRPIVTIVGGESLIGREVRDVIAGHKLAATVKLAGVEGAAMTLTEQHGEPAVITPMDEDNLLASQVVILAGSADSSRKALAIIGKSRSRPRVVDLSGTAEDDPAARLRAPMAESTYFRGSPRVIHVVAHPASIALAMFLQSLQKASPVRNSVVHILAPASEWGAKGLEDLRAQTVNLLSFKPLPKSVFDAQSAFNLLACYGGDAPEKLSSLELRIERHLASLLSASGGPLMPSLRVSQAPVFHGYSISAHVEFESRPGLDTLAGVLACDSVEVRDGKTEAPSNAGVAGQGGITVGCITADRNRPQAFWFWVVADNFRLVAENAVAVVRSLLAQSESGGAQ